MGSKTKTTTKVTPYDKASLDSSIAAQTGAYNQARDSINLNSPLLQGAINQIGSNINHPPAYLTDARGQLDKTINGDYVNSNPYTGGMADLIAKKTQGGYNASFGAAGRSHGGLAALLSSQGVGDALGSFYGQQYNNERGLQQQAIGMAPGFHQDQYTDINNLFPAVNNAAMLPLNAAGAYGSQLTNATAPYAKTTQTQKQGFGLAQAIGLGLQGASAFGGGGLFGGGGGNTMGGITGGGNMTGAISNPWGSGGFSGLLSQPFIPQVSSGYNNAWGFH